jgi:hypothetical protein
MTELIDNLSTLKHHISEALRYMENAPDTSLFPGFDCGFAELTLAQEKIEKILVDEVENEAWCQQLKEEN